MCRSPNKCAAGRISEFLCKACFSTYAGICVIQVTLGEMHRQSRVVTFPDIAARCIKRVLAATDECGTDVDLIAETLGLKRQAVAATLGYLREQLSLESVVQGMSVMSRARIEAGREREPVDILLAEEELTLLREAVESLGPTASKVIAHRYGLNGWEPTLRHDLEKKFGLPKFSLRQVEAKIIALLRERMA